MRVRGPVDDSKISAFRGQWGEVTLNCTLSDRHVHFSQDGTMRVLPNPDCGLLTKLPQRRTENG
jgi:hypothetical protein